MAKYRVVLPTIFASKGESRKGELISFHGGYTVVYRGFSGSFRSGYVKSRPCWL